MKLVKTAFLSLALLLAGGIMTLAFLVRPTQQLTLEYSKVPWPEKIRSAVLHLGVLTLTEADVTNLVREYIKKSPETKNLPITGAAVELDRDAAVLHVNLQKGALAVGLQVKGSVRYSNHSLQIIPTEYQLGRIPVSPETFETMLALWNIPLKTPVAIDLQAYVPREIAIQDVRVQPDGLKFQLVPKVFPRD